ncbi:MAG: hypothetical protein GX894_05710 [Clostridia bacterium]|nr:hypothetical protein [Clostridia bacterium]
MRKPDKRQKLQKNLFPGPAAGPKGQSSGHGRIKCASAHDEEELRSALTPLKPALDAFGEETEEILSGLPTPNMAYFAGLAREGLAGRESARKRPTSIEAVAFIAVAIAYLSSVLWFLQAGYFLPVVVCYCTVALFLPTVILFVPEARQREVNER